MVDTMSFTPVTSEASPLSTLRAPRPVDVVQIQTTDTTVFTARDDADFSIHALTAVNVTAASDWVTVHLVPSGGSATTANTIVYQRSVPAFLGVNIFTEEVRGLLQPGFSIVATCSTNDAINIHGFGFDYQGVYGA